MHWCGRWAGPPSRYRHRCTWRRRLDRAISRPQWGHTTLAQSRSCWSRSQRCPKSRPWHRHANLNLCGGFCRGWCTRTWAARLVYRAYGPLSQYGHRAWRPCLATSSAFSSLLPPSPSGSAAMAAPSSLDRAAAALLAAEAITLPRKQSGITRCTLCLVVLYPVPVADPPPRFIGEILRGATPFRPRFGRASSSRRGESALVIGRATDRCFQEAIETGRVPARTDRTTFAVNALSALRGTGIRSVRTQFPVMHGTVGTRLDGIGVCTRHGQTYIVIIELKTTGRDPADNRAYDCPCSLLPDLHLLGLPNTERTAHSIQAEFGRIAFVSSYSSRCAIRAADRVGSEPARGHFQIARRDWPAAPIGIFGAADGAGWGEHCAAPHAAAGLSDHFVAGARSCWRLVHLHGGGHDHRVRTSTPLQGAGCQGARGGRGEHSAALQGQSGGGGVPRGDQVAPAPGALMAVCTRDRSIRQQD